MNNPSNFHAKDGSGYDLWVNSVLELNKINPQVAARLARGLDRWKKFSKTNKELMHAALERVSMEKDLSSDVQEVITKALH
jgi:aminopeptidase N